MFKVIFQIYLMYALSIIIHEILHYLTLLIFKKQANGVFIGGPMLSIKVGILHISPLMANGYVDIDEEQVQNMNKLELILFFLSGILGNAILMGVSFFIDNLILRVFLFYTNVFIILKNSIPYINKTNDVSTLIKYYKEIQ